jgi:hypothetical protein
MPDARDAESPGYAGVLYAGDPHDGPACFEALRNALSERRIAALFLRLSPFGHPPAVAPHLLAFEHPTVYVPLEHGYAHAFEGASCANHRTKVRRAQKNGFRVVLTEQPEPDALDAFRGLYTATMERLSATNEYHYPRGYYTSLARDLGPRIALAYATHDDAPGMHYAVLLLRGDRHAHYHLGARREDVDPTAGNLVFDAAAQWAAGHGLAALHLGGGTTPSRDDSLYAFKSRIARGETALRCAGVVADRALYDALVQRWSALGGTKPRWFLTWRQPIAAQASSIEVSV